MSGPGGSSVKVSLITVIGSYPSDLCSQKVVNSSTSSSSKKREREEVNWVEIFSSDDEFQGNSTSRSART